MSTAIQQEPLRKLLIVLFLALMVAPILTASPLKVSHKSGRARVRKKQGGQYEIGKGDTITPGDTIRTYRNSTISLKGNEYSYKIYQSSLVTVGDVPLLSYGKLSRSKEQNFVDLHFYYFPAPAQGRTMKIVVFSRDDTIDIQISLVGRGERNRAVRMYEIGDGKYRGLTGFDCTAPADRYKLVIKGMRSNGDFTQVIYPFYLKKTAFERGAVYLSLQKGVLLKPSEQKRRESEILAEILSNSVEQALWRGRFLHPVKDHEVISTFGKRRFYYINNRFSRIRNHRGIDYRAPQGTYVYAPANGLVVLAVRRITTGNTVVIDHGQGVFSLFFHLSSMSVAENSKVESGDKIGQSGSTGIAVGAHVHWSVVVNRVYVNPADWLHRVF